jgi:hypothetical protein
MAAITTYGTSGLVATTIANYIPTLEDNVFSSMPLLAILKPRIKSFTGLKIVQPLLYGEAPNAGVYSDADTFATAANSGISAAEFEFRQYYGLTHFTGIELAKNSGKQALLNLVSARLKQLEMTIAENLDEMLFTGTDATKQMLGITVACATKDNTVGDIDSTTYTWWEPSLNENAVALSLSVMRRLYNSASSGNDHPTNILTDQHEFEAYENLIDDNARFLDPKLADAGFQNLMFKAAPIMFDKYCPNGYMYFINTKYLTLAKLADVWFKVSDWLFPTNADVMFKHIRCYGNLIISNRARQAAATALTDS